MAKLTSDAFKTNLKSGKYGSAGGARKALGKAQEISEADKATLSTSINKHFGASAAPAKAAPKAPAAPKTAAKKTARKASAKGTKTSAKKTPRAPKTAGSSSPGTAPRDGGNEAISAAENLMKNAAMSMTAITAIRVPGVESAPAIEVLQDHLVHGSKVLDSYLTQLENANKEQAAQASAPVVKTRAPRASKTETSKTANGVSEKSAQDFEDSLPGASEA